MYELHHRLRSSLYELQQHSMYCMRLHRKLGANRHYMHLPDSNNSPQRRSLCALLNPDRLLAVYHPHDLHSLCLRILLQHIVKLLTLFHGVRNLLELVCMYPV